MCAIQAQVNFIQLATHLQVDFILMKKLIQLFTFCQGGSVTFKVYYRASAPKVHVHMASEGLR